MKSHADMGTEERLELARGFAAAVDRDSFAKLHGWSSEGIRKLAHRLGVSIPRIAGGRKKRQTIEQVKQKLESAPKLVAKSAVEAQSVELDKLRKENLVLRTLLTYVADQGGLDFLSLEVRQ